AQRWIAGEPNRERLRSTLGGPLDGTLAERMVLSEEGVVRVPEHLSDEEAATLPCAAVTAWNALVTEGRVTAGGAGLGHGAGGVGRSAARVGVCVGAGVVVPRGDDGRPAGAGGVGGGGGINCGGGRAGGDRAGGRAGGGGVAHVVGVGGAGTLGQSLRAVRMGG